VSRVLVAILFGLGAATVWGVSAYMGALAARQFGSMLTNFGVQIGSLVVLGPLALLFLHIHAGFPAPSDLAILVVIGALQGGLNLLAYHLVTVGAVAVIYPILASNGAVVSLLAILLFHERLDAAQGIGLIMVTVGVLATAYGRDAHSAAGVRLVPLMAEPGRSRKDLVPTQAARSTILLAFGVAVAYGCALFVVIHYIKRLGWYLPMTVDRGSQTVLSLGLFAGGFPPRRHLRGHASRWWMLLVLLGILDTIGLVIYGLGNQIASTAIVATTSSTFVVLPVVLGILLIHERPRGRQLVGLVSVVTGLILLGV
jgi:drug/metabolite transporter (DMT)-like permease